jgi:hypothetical protein
MSMQPRMTSSAPPPADEPGEPLRPAATRDDPDRDFGLAEARPAQRGVTHVEGHRELAPAAAADALDDGDGGLRQCPELFCQGVKHAELVVQGCVVGRQSRNQFHVRVCDEELGVRGVDDHHS